MGTIFFGHGVHREVGRAKDLSAPPVHSISNSVSFISLSLWYYAITYTRATSSALQLCIISSLFSEIMNLLSLHPRFTYFNSCIWLYVT